MNGEDAGQRQEGKGRTTGAQKARHTPGDRQRREIKHGKARPRRRDRRTQARAHTEEIRRMPIRIPGDIRATEAQREG